MCWLVASSLMIRSFLALQTVSPGFTHPEWIQTVRISIPEALTKDPEQVIRMQSEILNRLSVLPGVTGAGFASGLPLESEYRNGTVIAVEGKTSPDQMPPNRSLKMISPGLLATQGSRLIAGRDFTWEDVFGKRRVAIVSQNMAREYWREPGAALGKRITIGRDGPWTEVVGVAEDIYTDGLSHPAPPTVYDRAGVDPPDRPGGSAKVRRAVTFAIRSQRAGTEALVRELAIAIHSPSVPIYRWLKCGLWTMFTGSRWRRHPSPSFCSAYPERWP